MTTMIVFLGEKKMAHCGTKRDKKAMGGRMTYGMGKKVNSDKGNRAARREYRNGGSVMKNAMPKCMPN